MTDDKYKWRDGANKSAAPEASALDDLTQAALRRLAGQRRAEWQFAPPLPMFDHIWVTLEAQRLDPRYVLRCLLRHACGDWGVCCDEDRIQNDYHRSSGVGLLHSAYAIDESKPCEGHGDNTVWIISQQHAHTTTVLLPEEY